MNILIIDDNFDYCTTIADIVQSFGNETHTIQDPEKAIEYFSMNRSKIDIVFLDIEFGPDATMNGIDVLKHCRKNYPDMPVIMISGKGTIDMAVQATKIGAVNFVEKGVISKEKIREVLDALQQRLGVSAESKEIRKFLISQGIIGSSNALLEIGDSIVRFGRTDLNVLISGETGTGKKLVATAIHAISRRAKYPMVTVDIPNIPRELFQSELFGHNKGSFSGATETKKGMFRQANKGTLFLDEIGDLSLELQSNLFIPIEEKKIRKVGSTESEDLDVRFVSATDRDLLKAMNESRFREQLYHRLRECEIHISPLRDRLEDIPDIVEYYCKKHNKSFDDNKFFSPSSISFLQEQKWPGNVRELTSCLRVVLQTAQTTEIEISDLHRVILVSGSEEGQKGGTVDAFISKNKTLKEDLARVDKKKIEATLERCNGNVSKSAAQLGISRETLHNKIRKYEINTQIYRVKKTK
ncbi:MAG: sigma-54 dependent transcriptional regulator [Candidatus Kapabacteria bacterium]|jgi:DNA-binding NtrC family response regulator|nr:sigma-54 dependent transcriptional regulator [Candidatus Kapabacteria bacterium]